MGGSTTPVRADQQAGGFVPYVMGPLTKCGIKEQGLMVCLPQQNSGQVHMNTLCHLAIMPMLLDIHNCMVAAG